MSSDPRSDWFEIGAVVVRTVLFEDEVTKLLVDPTNLVVTVKDPDGVETTPAIIRDSVGRYHVRLEPALAGVWTLLWASTGEGKGAMRDHFLMLESPV